MFERQPKIVTLETIESLCKPSKKNMHKTKEIQTSISKKEMPISNKKTVDEEERILWL